MWDRQEHKLALLELLATGKLRKRRSQVAAWEWLAQLSWTMKSGRRDEIALNEDRDPEGKRLLDQVWPGWSDVLAELESAGLPVSERGWRQLQDMERRRTAVGLPPRLNRRTALAQVGGHSKTTLSRMLQESLSKTDLTHDGTVRLRPPAGLEVVCGNITVKADVIVSLLGEVILTERALLAGTRFSGIMPRLLLTVENLGPYLDIRVPADCLVAHVPGWDTRTIRMVFDLLPAVPCVHFGDLDPNGVRIMRHLHELRPEIGWLVPAFWSEYIDTKGLEAEWPSELDLTNTPAFVQSLARKGIWLEQEVITLDERINSLLSETFRLPDVWRL
jgi:hypothetical protein